MINEVILSGRLVKDPEIKKTKYDNFFCYFAIAVERDYKDDENETEVDFIDCITFNNTAKYLYNYAYKGREITVRGRLQKRTYENKSGKKSTIMEVKVEKIQLYGASKQTYERRKKRANKDK